jgi:hypothetical protein
MSATASAVGCARPLAQVHRASKRADPLVAKGKGEYRSLRDYIVTTAGCAKSATRTSGFFEGSATFAGPTLVTLDFCFRSPATGAAARAWVPQGRRTSSLARDRGAAGGVPTPQRWNS